jgi:SAM-dependent methyltransferase
VPDLDQIRDTWDQDAGWTAQGDEWSGPWGGSDSQWWGTLLPRIHNFLPAGTLLELGPGQGRWTNYLQHHAGRLILVDVAEHGLEVCRTRFGTGEKFSYHVGDGRSLPMVTDGSIDFTFSFDSLVHAEADVLAGYAGELARVLAPDGVAFLHHSNMAAYPRAAALARRLPDRLRRPLTRAGAVINLYAWRAESTSAALFARQCAAAGLSLIGQELIVWEYGHYLSDVISIVTRPGSRWDRPARAVRNRQFMKEAHQRARVAPLYGAASWPGARG